MMPLTESLEAGPIRRGKLSLVDLAGSERQAKTGEFKMATRTISRALFLHVILMFKTLTRTTNFTANLICHIYNTISQVIEVQ